jgi:hypothetical protein
MRQVATSRRDTMSHTEHWTLRKDGCVPRAASAAPALLKTALTFGFRSRKSLAPASLVPGGVALFMPLAAVFAIWFACVLPAAFTLDKNRTATSCLLCAGTILFVAYFGAVVVCAVFHAHLALFCGSSLAAHLAWFLATAHPDLVHGHRTLSTLMHAAVATMVVVTCSWPPTSAETPDIAYFALAWLPECINFFVLDAFEMFAGFMLQQSTCWQLVGEKEE